MENTITRIAIIAIIVEDEASIDQLNDILFQFRVHIIGRMGLPYSKKNISLISVVVDAPQDIINTISGKIGRLEGITSKTTYSKV